jgi:DNA-binding response OmpR family regulator
LDNKHHIVIGVDDAPDTRALLAALLSHHGYHFFGCESGAECLGLVTRVSPRLILLDVDMPYMDGFETCRRLRAMEPLKPVPIAFLTARKTRDDVRQGLQAGGNDFILKPLDGARLLDRVQHWTSKRLAVAAY